MNDNHQKTRSSVQVHEHLTHVGWISSPEMHSLAYWVQRLADEIEGVALYDAARRQLREMSWENVRALRSNHNVVTDAFPGLVRAFLKKHGHRFPRKYDQCLREIRAAVETKQSIAA